MNPPEAACSPRSAASGVQDPAAQLPVKRAPVEPTPAAGQSPATAVLPVMPAAAAGDTKQPSGPAGEATGPEGDEQEAATEWADQKAAEIGLIWLSRYPGGRDW